MTKLKIKVGAKWPKWYKVAWVRNDRLPQAVANSRPTLVGTSAYRYTEHKLFHGISLCLFLLAEIVSHPVSVEVSWSRYVWLPQWRCVLPHSESNEVHYFHTTYSSDRTRMFQIYYSDQQGDQVPGIFLVCTEKNTPSQEARNYFPSPGNLLISERFASCVYFTNSQCAYHFDHLGLLPKIATNHTVNLAKSP